MKRLLSIALVLALLCVAAHAGGIESVPGYIEDVLGHAPEIVDQAVKVNALNLILGDDDQAVISWTDASCSRIYGIQDSMDRLALLYVNLAGMADWDVCSLYVGKTPLAGYNSTAGVDKNYASIDDFTTFVCDYFGITSKAAVGDSPKASAVTYVLNTNTQKFHYPDCPSAKQIKDKNRKEYTGTRENAIAQGYVPCKNCNP